MHTCMHTCTHTQAEDRGEPEQVRDKVIKAGQSRDWWLRIRVGCSVKADQVRQDRDRRAG